MGHLSINWIFKNIKALLFLGIIIFWWSFIYLFICMIPLFVFNWSIVALQCCVSFCCTAQLSSHTYTYSPSFLDFLTIQVTTEHRVEFSVLYSLFSLVIYFIHSSVYMSIPISQSIPPHPPVLVSICLFSTSVSLFLLCK